MKFQLEKAVEVLRQTPYTVQRMFEGLSDEWIESSGNREDWGPYDIVGHLIHGLRDLLRDHTGFADAHHYDFARAVEDQLSCTLDLCFVQTQCSARNGVSLEPKKLDDLIGM